MTKVQKEALINAVKEPLRLLVLALIPFLLSYFGAFNETWAILITLVLRGIEKYLYERKSTNIVTEFLKFE